MPIVNVLEGNLLYYFQDGRFSRGGIVHGCNCYHTMGAGIAGQIAKLFPEAYAEDRLTQPGPAKLGTYSSVYITRTRGASWRTSVKLGEIVNMYTQDRPGREDQMVLEATIRHGFALLNKVNQGRTGVPYGIPQIGCGIAGGDWNRVSAIIDEVTPNLDITLVNYQTAVGA